MNLSVTTQAPGQVAIVGFSVSPCVPGLFCVPNNTCLPIPVSACGFSTNQSLDIIQAPGPVLNNVSLPFGIGGLATITAVVPHQVGVTFSTQAVVYDPVCGTFLNVAVLTQAHNILILP